MAEQRKLWLPTLAGVITLLPVLVRAGDEPSMGAHMDADPWYALVRVDRLEWQDADEGSAVAWQVDAWAGRDAGRGLLRAEGERTDGVTEENRVELLGWMPASAYWNLVAGLRQDFEPASPRTYLAFGVEGLAPGWVHLEATGYYGERGQLAANVAAELELLLTNRLILLPEVELEAWSRDDEVNGLGAGLGTVELGLRLRYEIRREFAPYAGLEWAGKVGATADLAREAGEPVRESRWVAGLRVWF